MTKILVTGAAGHLGTAFIEHLERNTDWEIVALTRDASGHPQRWTGRFWPNTVSWLHDFRAPVPSIIQQWSKGTDYIVHLGGEVHGIRSVSNPEAFVQSNVLGTFNMLEMARAIKPRAFLYVSTAEVYGPSDVAFMPEFYLIPHKEDATLYPRTPYAASKAAAEALIHSYHRSFEVPTVIVRTMNLFGEQQSGDKFIPKVIRAVRDGETIDIHTSETGADKRQWIHVDTFSNALHFLLEHGMFGETYNVAGEQITNEMLAKQIAGIMSRSLIYRSKDTSTSPAHNIAYAIDDKKIRTLGWREPESFYNSLYRTVDWTIQHPEWV